MTNPQSQPTEAEYSARADRSEHWTNQLIELHECQQRTLTGAIKALAIELGEEVDGDTATAIRCAASERECSKMLAMFEFVDGVMSAAIVESRTSKAVTSSVVLPDGRRAIVKSPLQRSEEFGGAVFNASV